MVRGGSGTWNLKSGLIQAPGPVEAVRRDGRKLTAAGLDGNTRKGFLDLQQPVKLLLENDRGTISAGRTRWLFSSQQLQSDQPVQADLQKAKVQGMGFKLDERSGTVIPSNCLNRNELTAWRCAGTGAMNGLLPMAMWSCAEPTPTRPRELHGWKQPFLTG